MGREVAGAVVGGERRRCVGIVASACVCGGKESVCMLSNEQIGRVRELLARGLTQRRIAKVVGVSRGSVTRVVNGRCREREEEVVPDAVCRPYVCESCGYYVRVRPCVICAARASASGRALVVEVLASLGVSVGVELQGDARRVYEEIRAKKARGESGGPASGWERKDGVLAEQRTRFPKRGRERERVLPNSGDF